MSRYPVYTLIVTSCLALAVGCNRTERTSATGEAHREATGRNTGVGYVRYVNLMDAHTNTDLYFGDLKVFSGPSSDQPTGYKDIPADRRDFILREADKPSGVEIVKNSEGISAGKRYTVLAYEDENGKPILKAMTDDESAPDAGKAKIRLVHAAARTEPVDLYVQGAKDKLVGESRFSTVSSWKEVDPVSSPLEIRAGGDKTGARAEIAGPIEPGRLYTFIVAHQPNAADKLRVIQIVDNPTTTQ